MRTHQNLFCVFVFLPSAVRASPLFRVPPSYWEPLGLETLKTRYPTLWKAGASHCHLTVSPTNTRSEDGLHAYPGP